MQNALSFLTELQDKFDKFGSFTFTLPVVGEISANYFQAGLIVFLLFVLVLTLGQLRRRFVDWHLGGFVPGVAFGVLLILGIQVGLFFTGRTLLEPILCFRKL